MDKGNKNLVYFSKFPGFYIGGPFESLYLEKKAHYPIAGMVLNALL